MYAGKQHRKMDAEDNTKELATKEDKVIKSTLLLYEDNENKLKLIDCLKSHMSKIEGLSCDESIKSDLIRIIEHVSNSIKVSHKLNFIQLKNTNPSAHQTQEACERIKKGKQKANEDAVCMLINMLNSCNESNTTIRVKLPTTKDKCAKNLQILNFIDLLSPKNGLLCKPYEVWDVFNNIKLNFGENVFKYIKNSLEFIKKSDNNICLVPACFRAILRCIDKSNDKLEEDWNTKGRKRLACLNDIINIIFKKAKSNPGMGVPEKDISDVIGQKINEKVDNNNYIASDRTITRYMSKIKVESAIDSRFSVTKARIKKDKLRYTSENSLCNVLLYAIAVLSAHFVAGEELESQIYDKLSDDAKSTIELTKKVHNTEKYYH